MPGKLSGISFFPKESIMKFKYVCHDCGKEYVTDDIMYLCPECADHQEKGTFMKGVLTVILDDEYMKSLKKKEHVTMYDFFPYEVPEKETYPVGNTPIVKPKRLIEKYGLKNLVLKLDSQLPSGSFKDRASQLIAAQAIHHKIKKVCLASTGNAGAAMSCAGAAYGLDIILFVPQTAPINKLMQSVLYGAHVVPVKGTYDDACLLSVEYSRLKGGINRNTAYNPMTIEGKKSISIELFEQLGRQCPDVIYVPTGDGCILGGVWKGFADLRQAGIIEKIPHIVCCQSKKSNAISQAFKSGKFLPMENPTTIADSISVSAPENGRMAVYGIKDSEGWCVEVEDEDILSAQMELTREAGVFAEPAAACAFAGFRKDLENIKKKFGDDVKATVLLTGTGFKDMAVFDGRVEVPKAIENSVEAVKNLPF